MTQILSNTSMSQITFCLKIRCLIFVFFFFLQMVEEKGEMPDMFEMESPAAVSEMEHEPL